MPHPPPPANRCHAPPRHKLALLTFVGLVVPVYIIPPTLAAVLPWGRVAIVLGSLALIVPLMSYAIMPTLMWLFNGYVWASVARTPRRSAPCEQARPSSTR